MRKRNIVKTYAEKYGGVPGQVGKGGAGEKKKVGENDDINDFTDIMHAEEGGRQRTSQQQQQRKDREDDGGDSSSASVVEDEEDEGVRHTGGAGARGTTGTYASARS